MPSQLAAFNAELQTLIDTANAPIFAIDAAQQITVWNKKISEMTSIPQSSATGRAVGALFGTLVAGGPESGAEPAKPPAAGSSCDTCRPLDAAVRAFEQALALGERSTCVELELKSLVHRRPIELQMSVEPKRDADGGSYLTPNIGVVNSPTIS